MDSKFDGGLLGLIGIRLLAAIIIIFSFGICTPWAVCIEEQWCAEHTVIDGMRLSFDGKAMQLFGNWIKWLLLTIVTFGIYSFWIPIKMKQWVVSHTYHVSDEKR